MVVTNSSTDSAQMAHAAVSSQNGTVMKGTTSSVTAHNRRRSLPPNFQANLWSGNPNPNPSSSSRYSKAELSLAESGEAARGERTYNSLDPPLAVLHQIHAASPPRSPSRFSNSGYVSFSSPRYSKSASARNSTFSQPVVVRTYSSPSSRPGSRHLSSPRIKKSIYKMTKAELPPVEAFTFKGIMDSIQGSVAEDLERIAEICARSRYSLSNQYEVHMPPHGQGEAIFRPVGDEEIGRSIGVGRARGGRKTKSKAFDTLETIYSSSRSSEEGKAKKKSAGELAEEVRGRQSRKAAGQNIKVDETTDADAEQSVSNGHGRAGKPRVERHTHARSQSATFASMVMVTAQASRSDTSSRHGASSSLVSEPLLPRASRTLERGELVVKATIPPAPSAATPAFPPKPPAAMPHTKGVPIDHPDTRASVLANFSSWLPWLKPADAVEEPVSLRAHGRQRALSSAEGSLRQLLGPSDGDRKGKGVNRESG